LGQFLTRCQLFHRQFLGAITPRKIAKTAYGCPCEDDYSYRWLTCQRDESAQQLKA